MDIQKIITEITMLFSLILVNIFHWLPEILTIATSLSALIWYWMQIIHFRRRNKPK